jgi:peptidyl-prolyl cis-trans isomerase D
MISGFRKSLRSWFTIGLLFLALVAIVVTGFGTGGGGGLGALSGRNAGPTGDQLATVNGEPITADAASTEVNRSFQLLRQRLPNADMAEYMRQGGYEGAVDALINLMAMRQYGVARGLVATPQMVDRFLVNRREFQNALGQYDPALYQQYLQLSGVNERALRNDIARDLMRQQLLDPVAPQSEPGSPQILRVPQGVARAYAAVRLERRRGAIGVVPIAALAAGINPSDAEIARHYARNRAQYTVPERRVIKYAVIGAEQATAPAPTEAEIQAVYRNTPHYQRREARTLQSVTFTGASALATAQAFAQRVRGGTAFLDAARQAGYAPGDVVLADQSQAQFARVTSAEVAAQVFRAAQGSVTGPIRSPLGVHVVRVERVTPSAGRPLETVRADIVRELVRRKGAIAVVALARRIEDQIDAGGSFEEIARAARLTVVTTPPITARGLLASGQAWAVPAELRPLLAATFDIDADNPEPAVAPIQENARYALIAVDRSEPAAVPPLAQVRDRVRATLIREQALARARQTANAIVARIRAGVPPARAFAEAMPGLPPPEQIDLRRLDIMRVDRQAPPPLLALFRIRPGTAEVLAAPNAAGWYVIAAQQSVRGDIASTPQALGPTQQELQETAGTELELQFLRAMVLRANVQRNDAAIRAERQRLSGGVPPAQ